MINIIRYKNLYFFISGILVGASIFSIAVFGFRQAIDFSGGTLWQFSLGEKGSTSLNLIEEVFKKDLGINEVRLNYDLTNNYFFAKLPTITEEEHQKFLGIFKNRFPSFREESFESVGPSVGKELKKNAIFAIILVLIGISIYIAFAFRKVSKPVSSWKYGLATLLALFHDVSIPLGLLAILGHFSKVEVGTDIVVALLVVVGFSVHDTIVVFDRIRENLRLDRGKTKFEVIINNSVNQTLARSINTSLTLILVLIALLFFGPPTLKYFILVLLVGVTAGTYSSIFIASPLLILMSSKEIKA